MMLFAIEDRSKCVPLQHPDVGFTQCAFHGGGVGNDIDQARCSIKTTPKIVVLPAGATQEAREMFKLSSLESRCVCPVPKQNRVNRTDAINADLTVLFDGTPFLHRKCPNIPKWKSYVVNEHFLMKRRGRVASH
jgi:hypothetical protein